MSDLEDPREGVTHPVCDDQRHPPISASWCRKGRGVCMLENYMSTGWKASQELEKGLRILKSGVAAHFGMIASELYFVL